MKYAIYDKAADGYLTKMEFEVGYSEHTQFECGYNEYITEAKLLDTKEEAVAVVTRIESFKFMDKGRFVTHSFDDTLKDQYIISEAGTPTKVVDNITVDLDGTINVKYGTMVSHWSATSLEYAVNRMNALQKAKSPKYTAWCNTFDIYKVITVMDEKSCTHYQFIKVTEKGLAKYAKDEEVVSFNKRIEELEKANYELGEQVAERGAVANRLQEENDKLKTKVESIKKEARDWKNLYEKAGKDRETLMNVIDNIYDDLGSVDICKDLGHTYDYVKCLSELNYIMAHNDDTDDGKPIYITAAAEFKYIIDRIITIMESRALNQSVAFSAAEDVKIANNIAEKIISICEADDKFEVTLKKFSQLYEAVNDPGDDDDTIMYAFKGVLEIFSSLEDHVKSIIDESVTWKNKAQKAEKALDDQNKLIARMVVEKRAMNKELSDAADALEEVNDKNEELANMLKEITSYVADIMLATRTTDHNKMISDLTDVSLKIGVKPIDEGPIYGISVTLNILIRILKDRAYFERHLEEAKNVVTVITKERDKALERSEFYKRQANSVYGMTVPTRRCGKQAFCDAVNGKKILIDKKKYDDLVEYIANINLTYDSMFCMMDKPVYLSTITESLNNLTK